MPHSRRLVLAVVLALLATTAATPDDQALAADPLPIYSVDVVVPNGVATAINGAGDIVGWQNVDGATRAFVHSAGVLRLLPTPLGRPLSIARDINDAGAIVGSAQTAVIDEPGHAMRWTKGTAGWTATDLGFLTGDLVSEATGLNERGQIVGRSNPRSVLHEHGFLYTDSAGMTPLLPDRTFVPQDVNEAGVAVGNGYTAAQRADSTTGLGTSLGVLEPYLYSHAYAINDMGTVAGALTRSTGAQAIARFSDSTGWQVLGGLGGSSVENIGWGINSSGTVVGRGWPRTGTLAPYERGVIWLDSAGTLLYVDDLLQAGTEWSIYAAYDINDAGQIAGYARNPLTGQTAAVRLTPGGVVQAPSAPSALTATPYAAVLSSETNRIDLRWTDNSANETGFEVERRRVDQYGTTLTAFTRLLTTGANVTSYSDSAISPGLYYRYRVRAVGLAGPSAYSNTATARAPTTSPETTPPSVTITSPLSQATVSRIVTVKIRATDNVGVTRFELLVDTRLAGTCSVATIPVYKCRWDTRKWSNGGWTLYARAWDAAGNMGTYATTVFVRN